MSLAVPLPAEGAFSDRMAEAFAERIPIVCFANDWRGDPTSKHHIMRHFSEHTEVLWVEASGMRTPRLSRKSDLGRIVGRLRAAAGGMRREREGLHVLSPLSLPLPGSRAAAWLNRLLYRWSIRRALRRLGVEKAPLIWVYNPSVEPYLCGMPRAALVYHCVDRWWAFSEYDPQVMRRHHAGLCREADLVLASAVALLEDCREHAPHAALMRHGVDWEHFARAALQSLPPPPDIADVQGPILGFFGLLHDWVDQEVLLRLAECFPDATLVLIGKAQVDFSRVLALPNVRWLGQKPYSELPAYAAAFDVALIPFHINDLTRAVNPIKLREYLSAGAPVVATALPEIELFQGNPMLRTARGADEFVTAVGDLLATAVNPERRREAALAMQAESWAGRCAEMADLVEDVIGRSRPPAPARRSSGTNAGS